MSNRPISKAYMSSLSDRISMLEGMLLEKGVAPPPAAHPPKTRHEAQPKTSEEERKHHGTQQKARESSERSPQAEVPSPPDSANEDYTMQDSDRADSAHADGPVSASQIFQPLPKEQSPFRMLDPKQEDIVHRLLSTKGNLSFDQLSGRLRFFGPTANSHVYAEPSDQFDFREPPEQVRRAERMIRSITAETHDYLMDNFWNHYNSVLKVIHQEAFDADRESQNPKFYSSFLHICILAMAFRFADADRDDMKRIALGGRESTLHREAKYMLDIELERPGGIPSVQALLLLGDLECGVGRDNTGWMYAGMANRLAFDIGLHLDCRNTGINEQEVDIRHMVMRACVIYDRYWALFLGRPTSIKNQDIGMDLLSRRFSQLTSLMGGPGAAHKKNIAAEVYDQLIELMELAGRIVETREVRNKQRGDGTDNVFNTNEGEDNAYLHAINLDRQLQNWYRRLPEHLQWKPSAIKSAPFSYFLLHQQYHVSMILLHRPWAKYGAIAGDGTSTGSHPSPASASEPKDVLDQHPFSLPINSPGMADPHAMVDDSRTALSRSICTQQAIRVARIFWQHRQRFDGRKIFVTGIQHAGTAAIALIAALAYNHSESDRRTYLGYLEILSSAVSDMSHTYQPASRMDDLLKAVLVQLRADINDYNDGIQPPITLSGSDKSLLSSSGWRGNMDTIYSILPARREADAGSSQSHKRRRPSTTSRRASEFTRPPPPFFLTQSNTITSRASSHRSAGQHPPIDPAMYSLGSGDMQGFNLDFLNGSAIEADLDDASDGMLRPSEDFVLVASQSDGWTLGGLNAENTAQHGEAAYDGTGLGEWASGTTRPNASSALGGSDAVSSAARDNGRDGGGKEGGAAVPRGLLSEKLNQGSSVSTGDEADKSQPLNSVDSGSMDWMGSEGGLNALSPVSLSGLVQSAMPDKGESESSAVNRNHELDFFSF
ncbi:Nitrogen assimilation transcription factor nirA [Colletotrichum siamense]|uniref:Nitrogen assimilation transcription factor nirA n=1 Tax=Colletotrichum siamense TaxID=690259 RepID=A0A9P5BP73_COLSI|nr:Nitrogen assimilation transcription factor nirA [Colletotrichum siamense]KAF4855018.1 Nitrogen assimilation transcription factor nirA [Colletotrichum siamense]